MSDRTGGDPASRASASTRKSPEGVDPREGYVENVLMLDEGIEKCLYKLTGDGRIRDPDIEAVRSKYINSLCKLLRERRMTLESLERHELAERIETLEERLADVPEGRVRA